MLDVMALWMDLPLLLLLFASQVEKRSDVLAAEKGSTGNTW